MNDDLAASIRVMYHAVNIYGIVMLMVISLFFLPFSAVLLYVGKLC